MSVAARRIAPAPSPTSPVADRAERPRIVIRRVDVDTEERGEKYWYNGMPGVTAFAYALSAVFPDGERMFIDSVRHYRDQIKDPELQAEVRAFIGQEAQHGQVHERYNARADADGFAVSAVTAHAQRRMARVRKVAPPEVQLAITCALEHFTAMMAEQLLGNELMSEGVPESHATMWRWHAAEEAEHKAVAFDVYMTVDGSYVRRIRTYLVVSFMFSATTLATTYYLMAKDGTFFSLKNHAQLLRFLLVSPGLSRKVLPGWFDYLRPNFHPWDRDDRHLLERWKREWAPSFR
ncbi:MAG: metal-dependent hydrolase [Sandaracinaceae bacterium]|nr:metal-dependent hydrolase [Sandaracinaceae bacterium]